MTATFLSDDELMASVVNGDSDAFGVLCERWRDKLQSFAVSRCRDWQQAEDVVQDVFLKVLRNAVSFNGRGFAQWIYRITSNALVDDSRRRKTNIFRRAVKGSMVRRDDEQSIVDLISDKAAEAGQDLDHSEIMEWIDIAAEKLPPDQRMVFFLANTTGLELPEIAVVMEATLPATKSRLRLAKAKIRETFRIYGVRDPRTAECV